MPRISDEVFSKLGSLEALVNIMGKTKEGYTLSEVGDYKEFNNRFIAFKETLKKDLPEFTTEEILKFDSLFHKFKAIYEWYGASYLLAALEFEQRQNKP